MNIDILSPAYVGEDRIKLSLDPSTDPPRVGQAVAIRVDYSRSEPEGASLPLDFIVQGPSENSYHERVYRRYKPARLAFVPSEAGEHLVLLREQHHNRWFGKLVVVVEGDTREV